MVTHRQDYDRDLERTRTFLSRRWRQQCRAPKRSYISTKLNDDSNFQQMYLFTSGLGLSCDAVSSLDYTASNDRITVNGELERMWMDAVVPSAYGLRKLTQNLSG
jgi:hypothetical protein